jgi:hypothetical protein
MHLHYTEEMIMFARNWFVQGYFVAWLTFGALIALRALLNRMRRSRVPVTTQQ